ncbi:MULTISPECIES: PAS domain-containing protein [unclassified Isoptericola]|uniref:PAS domain-containing protein n=1 Tax=unclassified Isoptericola TaxID=2623355 RepID=UPI002713A9E8|nr:MULTISPECIES: PAS domain-containing protein [unclassified Isoptericola]MDO8145707.1 PAS domain-containing protein [Isoptericola sp. 178]MDO8152051.1 PAS domain-containing protein [Isoptericola sp. b408]
MSSLSSSRIMKSSALSSVTDALSTGTQLVVGQYRIDAPSGAVWWSDEVYRMYGSEPGDLTPTVDIIRARTHPDDRARVSRTAIVSLRAGRPFSSAHRIIDPHGKARTVVVTGRGQLDEDGAIARVGGYVLDVSPVAREVLDRESHRAVGRAMVSAAAVEQVKGALMIVRGLDEADATDLLGEVAARAGIPMQSAASQVVSELRTSRGEPDDRLQAALDAVHSVDRPHGHEAQLARRRQSTRR